MPTACALWLALNDVRSLGSSVQTQVLITGASCRAFTTAWSQPRFCTAVEVGKAGIGNVAAAVAAFWALSHDPYVTRLACNG